MSNEYKANGLDVALFEMRHALRKPIWFFSVIATLSFFLAAYFYFDKGTNFFVDRKVSEIASRASICGQILHPYSGGLLPWLFRVFALLMLASTLGGSWFTYVKRGSFRLGNFWHFATSGVSMVLLCGVTALYSAAVGGVTWVTALFGIPALVVMLYAVYGLCCTNRASARPVE